MKKIFYSIISFVTLTMGACSQSMLEFSPTDSGSAEE